jgi:hypothetical protein
MRQKSEPVWLGVPALRRFEQRPGFGWPCQQVGARLSRQCAATSLAVLLTQIIEAASKWIPSSDRRM